MRCSNAAKEMIKYDYEICITAALFTIRLEYAGHF